MNVFLYGNSLCVLLFVYFLKFVDLIPCKHVCLFPYSIYSLVTDQLAYLDDCIHLFFCQFIYLFLNSYIWGVGYHLHFCLKSACFERPFCLSVCLLPTWKDVVISGVMVSVPPFSAVCGGRMNSLVDAVTLLSSRWKVRLIRSSEIRNTRSATSSWASLAVLRWNLSTIFWWKIKVNPNAFRPLR